MIVLLINAVIILSVFSLLWWYQERVRNASCVDVFWALGIGWTGIVYGIFLEGIVWRKLLVTSFICVWALRLAGHLFTDRLYKKSEDPRYAHLRAKWGSQASQKFLLIFLFNAFIILLLSIPLLIADLSPAKEFSIGDGIGVLIWLIAISGEAKADQQLSQFRKNPANQGKTCQIGLWKFSRHPNYFFEWLHWFSYVFLSLSSGLFWLGLVGPGAMLFLLFFVTGIPPTEARALQTRADYADYQKRTSVFIPWKRKTKAA